VIERMTADFESHYVNLPPYHDHAFDGLLYLTETLCSPIALASTAALHDSAPSTHDIGTHPLSKLDFLAAREV
jgi:hypothetical protein